MLAFSCRRDLANAVSGANPEMADVASAASDSGQLRVEPGARWPNERA